MTPESQHKANQAYRNRLAQKGVTRLEIMAPERDRDLLRLIAKRLASNDDKAEDLRRALRSVAGEKSNTAVSILDALRNSPLCGADVLFSRQHDEARRIDL